ncbi:MAG: hypothetical protein KDC66_21720 [Phaeodactylibacter sp.]|nr:hypothetical protein [Phaeodactylibacter sp.]MCB9272918.1 hypothetical protein [Lewinellaceae bacterium]
MPSTISLEQALALSGFYEEHPLDFKLFDSEGEEVLYIVNDSFPGTTHYLLIENNTDKEIVIKEEGFLDDIRPSPDSYHFELRFRPGTLSPGYFGWISVGNSDWRIKPWRWQGAQAQQAGIEEGAISLFLLYIEGRERLAVPPLGTFILPLHNVKAGAEGGSRGSRVELHYQMAQTDEKLLLSPQPAEITVVEEIRAYYRQRRLNVLNNQGARTLPMNASFVSSNTIINNGHTANRLNLQLSNLLRNGQIALTRRNSESPSKFILSFDTSELSEAWAIADSDNVAAFDIDIELAGGRKVLWQVQKQLQGQSPQWVFTVSEDTLLDVGEHFLLKLSGIITAMPSGFTNLYLAYENIPGYWDGQFVVPIEKSPLKYQDDISEQGNNRRTWVGLGTDNPTAELEVDGKVIAETMDLTGKLTLDTLRFNSELQGDEITIAGKTGSVIFNEKYTITENVISGDSTLQVEGAEGADKAKVQIKGSLSADKALSAADAVSIGPFTIKKSHDEVQLQVEKGGASVGGIIPRGGIIMWSGKAGAIPAGWVLCDGVKYLFFENKSDGHIEPFQEASPPSLTQWDQVPGMELLTPDLRGRFIVGQSNDGASGSNTEANLPAYKTLDVAGGSREVTLTTGQMPSHNHGGSTATDGAHSHKIGIRGYDTGSANGADGSGDQPTISTFNDGAHSHSISSEGGGQAHENRPPYYVLAFIMKL